MKDSPKVDEALTTSVLRVENYSKLKSLVCYLKPYKKSIIGALIALLMTSSLVLGIGRGIGYLVDHGFSESDPGVLDNTLTILFLMIVFLATATFARFYLITYVGERAVADIRRDLYNHIIRLSPEFFEANKSGEILSRMTTDTTLLQSVVSSSLSVAARNTVMCIGGLILLLFTSVKLTSIVLLVVPLVVVPIIIIGKKVRKLSRQTQDKVALLSSHTEESVYGIKTLQSFTRETIESNYFKGLVEDVLLTAKMRICWRSMLTAIVITFVFGAVGFVLWVGGHDVLAGKMSHGELVSFIFYAVVVAGSVGAITEVFGDLQRASGAAERILELLGTRPLIADPAVPIGLPEKLTGKISFHNVTFTYPTDPARASLQNFSLEILPSESIAVVGPSGAGKTTIFQLLMRFYDAAHGSIGIDGVPINEIRLKELRQLFGLVPQDPVIFSGCAYDNILVGKPNASKNEVYAAAKAAAAHEFIEELPNGYDTFLGEKGVRLSGGQRQRIAIARAFLKNPRILLLDEATSALDAQNEKLVHDALEKLMKNRTTIIIAHRLATIQNAERIIVMDKGKIVEEGTHKQLLKNKLLYSKLAAMQFDM